MRRLDFIIVGAQKSATSALFEHLRSHPDIQMPLEKEVPFFIGDNYSPRAWDDYAQRYFGENDGILWGKATPQYLCDSQAPARIRELMPDVKIIAILRDPIDRTWSHYQMGLRRDTEQRDFDTAMRELLGDNALSVGREGCAPAHAGGYESEGDFYVAWSEYGRMLEKYAEVFGEEQILLLYTEDLQVDAAATLDRLLLFIGLEPGYRPPTLDRVIHRGGSGNRVPHSVRAWLRERRALYGLWQLLPDVQRGRLRFLYEQWNVRREPQATRRMSEQTRAALCRHFADDLTRLTALGVAPPPPWLADYVTG